MSSSVSTFASTFASTPTTFTSNYIINIVGVDANIDAWNSVNTHRFDVWCSCESSRIFDPAVGLGTSISGVEVPPPELRKVAHIPPTKLEMSVWYPTHSSSVWETQRGGSKIFVFLASASSHNNFPFVPPLIFRSNNPKRPR